MPHAQASTDAPAPTREDRRAFRPGREAVVVGGALVVAVLALLGPALVGSRSFGGADMLLNWDPWRATAPAGVEVTLAPMADLVDAWIPRLDDWGEGVRDAELRLWNPYLSGGTGQHSDAFAPTDVPYGLLPAQRATVWGVLLGVIVAIAGTIAFLRRVGLSNVASVVGATVYVFSGFQIVWTLWPQSHVGAVVPVLFWAVEREVQRPGARSVAAIALSTGWILVEGFPAVAVVAAAAAGLYGLARTVLDHDTTRARGRVIGGAAAGAVLGGAIAAIAIMPLGELLDRADLPRGSLAGANSEPLEAITLVSPDALGPPDGPYDGPSNAVEAASFVGAGALLLVGAAAAVRRSPGRRGVRPAAVGAAVVVGALIFVDGPHVDLAARLPVLDFNPLTRLRGLLGFAIAVGAAIGIDVLRNGIVWNRRRLLAVAGIGTALALFTLRDLDLYRDRTGISISMLDTVARPLIVAGLVVAAILIARLRPLAASPAIVAIVLVLVVDGASFASGWWRTTADEQFYPDTPVHVLLDEELGGDRFAGTGGSLVSGTGTFYGHREPTGNVGHTAAWADLLRAADPEVFVTTTLTRLGIGPAVIESPILDRLAVRFMSYPVGAVVGEVVAPPAPVDSLVVGAGETVGIDWPGPTTGAVLLTLDADLTSTDPFATVIAEVLDEDGVVVGSGRRRIFGGIPAGELRLPVTTPPADAARVEIRLSATDDASLVLGSDADSVPVSGSVTLPDGIAVVLADGVTLVERASFLPRIRWASHASVITDGPARVVALADGVDADTVVLSEAGPPGGGRAATVRVHDDAAEHIEVEVDAASAGYLVVADAIADTWKAQIDGEPATLVDADHATVAVFVEAGAHHIELDHERQAFRTGLIITLAALVMTVALLLVGVSRQGLARAALLLLGLVTVTVIAVVAWRSLDPRPEELRIAPLLGLAVLVLVSYVIVSIEFRLAGRILDVEIDAPTALVTTTIATTANLLPLPGAAITRVLVLRRGGAATAASVRLLAVIGGLWLGVSFVAAGFGIMTVRAGLGAALAAAGVVMTGVAVVLLHREGAGRRVVGSLIGAEATMIALGALRLWLALRGLGLDGSVGEVVSVGVAAPLSAAVGFVPAGLGVREAIAVVLGAVSGLGGVEAGVAATLDRTVGLMTLAPAAAIAFALRRRGVGA